MPPRRLRFSRWKRLPGVTRIGERKIPGPEQDLERLTLFLPGGVLDRAERLSREAGAESLQAYCEALLLDAIEGNEADRTIGEAEVKVHPLDGLDAVQNDPEYLREWTESILARGERRPGDDEAIDVEFFESSRVAAPDRRAAAVASILRHAAVEGADTAALMSALRRGERPSAVAVAEAGSALAILEETEREATQVDRRLAFALHRLAFEAQVLVTDAWPGLGSDPETVMALRRIQEGVDRVLSGHDIRYDPIEGSADGMPDEPAAT